MTRASAPAYNATDDSPVRPRGRFTCPRQLTTPWPTCRPRQLTNVAADSPVCTGLPRRGRFTRERLQLHLAIINFMADYFRPGTSGDIHLKYILLAHIIFVKEQFIFALVCTIVDAGHVFTTSKQTWLTRSRRFTAPQPVHLFELPLMRRSSFPSVYCGLVYIDTPGLHLSA